VLVALSTGLCCVTEIYQYVRMYAYVHTPTDLCLDTILVPEQVNHKRVRCGHKCSGWTHPQGADYVVCHFKGKPDVM
jgi:hypothetical protein